MDETTVREVGGAERLALSVTEAAQRLGISRAHAYRMAASGELPSLRLGGRMVVPVHQLLLWLGEPAARSRPDVVRDEAVAPVDTVGASASGRSLRFSDAGGGDGTAQRC